MAKRRTKDDALTVRFEPGTLPRLQKIRDRVGVPVAEQIRRAITEWLDRHEQRLTDKDR